MSSVYAQKNLTDTTGFPSTLEILLAGLDTVAFQLAGTFTGTVVFEATIDRTTYTALSVTPSTGAAAVTSATAAGIWAADGCAGFLSVRARCSVFASGVIVASVGAGANSVAAVSAAADGQVLFMNGTAPSGDADLTFDGTTLTATGLAAGTTTLTGTLTAVDVVVGTGKAIKTDTTIGHTALVQAYDVDGAAYKTFLTLTNGNTPDATLAAPAGSTMVIQPTTYKSSDGSSGVTAGPFTVISAITVKNGLITAITGT